MANLLNKRKDNARMVAEGRYIRHVMTEISESVLEAQQKVMAQNAFQHVNTRARSFTANEEGTQIKFQLVDRFIDISTRKTKSGAVKTKKSYPIYNRVVFGHIPDIVARLSYGFTDAVVEEFKKLESPP